MRQRFKKDQFRSEIRLNKRVAYILDKNRYKLLFADKSANERLGVKLFWNEIDVNVNIFVNYCTRSDNLINMIKSHTKFVFFWIAAICDMSQSTNGKKSILKEPNRGGFADNLAQQNRRRVRIYLESEQTSIWWSK